MASSAPLKDSDLGEGYSSNSALSLSSLAAELLLGPTDAVSEVASSSRSEWDDRVGWAGKAAVDSCSGCWWLLWGKSSLTRGWSWLSDVIAAC